MAYDETVSGIVLSSSPAGEYDRRVVLLTRERGKISAFARGARRPGNSLMAPSESFAFGEFSVYKGKSAYTIKKASIKEYFREISSDYEKACYGFYFLEVCDYFGLEGQDETNLITLLYMTLKALVRGALPAQLVKAVFDFKCLYLNGTYPDVFKCAICGKVEDLTLFSTRDSAIYCKSCAKKRELLGKMLSPACVLAMQVVITSSPGKLFSFSLEENILKEFVQTVKNYFSSVIEHSFKSEELL